MDKLIKDYGTAAFQSAIDPTELTQLTTTDISFRKMFYIANSDSPYNPTQGDGTYLFEYTGSPGNLNAPTLTSFREMEQYMSKPGDVKQAAEASKGLTDDLNTDGSMTQTVNAKLKEQVSQLTTFIQQTISFWQNAILKSPMTLINAAITNQIPK
jgi:hypothetical protein